MNIFARIFRFASKNGFSSLVPRLREELRQTCYCGRMVLYQCPLPAPITTAPSEFSITQITQFRSMNEADLAAICDVWDPESSRKEIHERFAKGSELWLAKIDDKLAGYGWSIGGDTFKPHYFKLRSDEVHLYNYHVFPEFRGRGVNVSLIRVILAQLSTRPFSRAHIECAAWNRSQIRSLSKTPFKLYAEIVRLKLRDFRKVLWLRGKPPV